MISAVKRASSTPRGSGASPAGCAEVTQSIDTKAGILGGLERRVRQQARWDGRLGVLDTRSQAFTSRVSAGSDPQATATGSASCTSSSSSSGQSDSNFFRAQLQMPGEVYVGVPSMASICQHLSGKATSTKWACKAQQIRFDAARRAWSVQGSEGRGEELVELGEYDVLVVADAMASHEVSAGSLKMDQAGLGEMARQMSSGTQSPVFSLMLALPQPLDAVPFDGAALSPGAPLAWMARDSSKPGRDAGGRGGETWVAVTTPVYARSLLQDHPMVREGRFQPQSREYLAAIAPLLLQEFRAALEPLVGEGGVPKPSWIRAMRWGKAFHNAPLGKPCLVDGGMRFVGCGDFCLGSTVENACLSGLAAADAVLNMLDQPKL